mgnify:CR=1 FL=1
MNQKIHELKNSSITDSELVFRDGVYKKDSDVYCSVCWDKDKRLSRVRKVKKDSSGNVVFICDVCNQWRFSNIPWEEL